ncbi:uncharacterized protein LOC141651662 [Silene latifolia]|uniref:uncharacterized protein LOC141651662 n=1 Tax=Silene latifolia TaxID=37657 RepID=UPI003D772E91
MVTLISSRIHEQLIHVELFHHVSNKHVHISFIYGSNVGDQRERLWDELRVIAPTVTTWAIMGDFNIVRDMEERLGPNPPSLSEVQMAQQALKDCLVQIQLNPLDSHLLTQEKTLLEQYLKLKGIERSSLLQRAKLQAIHYYDALTRYFFSRIAARKHQSLIGKIRDRHGQVQEGVQNVDETDWPALCRPVEEGEIRKALFSIDSNKSPGQNGFSSHFFKHYWEVIKRDFCSAIQDFFKKGSMHKQANTTLLALIPKKAVVSTVMDYRPIACCSVIYKTISKILCERLKPLLPAIVGKEQGAFVKDAWEFIGQMLKVFNYPPQFQKWILGCLTSTWFSIKIIGDVTGFLQGDDLMIFSRGDLPSVTTVTHTLSKFAKLSGLQANPDKTNIYLGGVRDHVKKLILDATGYIEGSFPFRYLGVPLNAGKLNKEMFTDLLANIQQSLHHWSAYKLSYAGKISLINTVIFGLEQFWCSTLLIPKGVIKLITKFCRNFLWNSVEGHIKLIWKSWISCCAPHQEGGFQIKEVLAWNMSVIYKWIWEIEKHSDNLWVTWNYEYNIKSGDFWRQEIKSFHSESWRNVLQVRDQLLQQFGTPAAAQQALHSCVKKRKLRMELIYEHFRVKYEKLRWPKAVWSRAVLPKHSLITVLAMQTTLATIDQLNIRGICLVNRCVLCKQATESHNHLFFRCPFSSSIWSILLHWMRIPGRTTNLKKELNWIASRRAKKHWKAMWFTGCVTALVYNIWEERNIRIFQDIEHDIDYVVKRIQYIISARLLHVMSTCRHVMLLAAFNV